MKIKTIAAFIFFSFYVCYASIRRSSLATYSIAMNASHGKSPYVPTSEYVQDGIIGLWDAVENVDWNTHDSSIGQINDLCGNNNPAVIMSYGRLLDNYVMCSGLGVYGSEALYILGRWATEPFYEIVVELKDIVSISEPIGIRQGRYNGVYLIPGYRIGVMDYIGLDKTTVPISSGFHTISVMCGDGIYVDGILMPLEDYSWSRPVGVSDASRLMCMEGKFFCLRKYNRKLTAEEVKYNHMIDKARFGL